MGFLRKFREGMAEARAEREAEEARKRAEREEEAARAEAEADEALRVRVFGDELAHFEVHTADDAKAAIKLAKLRKKEIQAEKRQLASELAEVREEWRERTAGRISTVGLGRSGGARVVRAGIQTKRRSERLDHAKEVNAFSDRRQILDQSLIVLDRLIVDLERQLRQGGA